MIRFLLDIETTDIIVITDNSIQRVDSYFIADFLEIKKNKDGEYDLSIKELFAELLHYWKALLSEDTSEVFLLYDLSDQFIAGFHLEDYDFKGRKYLRITKKSTPELTGWSLTKHTKLSELTSKTWNTDQVFSMQTNRKAILRGMDWSLENLRINTNPVNL
ncbi:hypothetical protein ACO2Q8_28605 [Larkinella sp. VNQ87]|uniref:hypothetical protein n=1 Tax=Larkinella sp. VNQ87 TaxID=3400921 RepID=UPI003C110AD0